MLIQVEVSYNMYGSQQIELPGGKTWEDVEYFYVKWDTVFIQFKGDEVVHEFELGTGEMMDNDDMKRPTSTEVYECDDGGDVDYSKQLV